MAKVYKLNSCSLFNFSLSKGTVSQDGSWIVKNWSHCGVYCTLYTVHTIVTVICIIQSCTLYSVQYTTQSIRGLLYILRLLTLIHAAVALNGANTTLHLNYAACAPNLNQNLQMPLQQNMQFPSIFVNYINNLLN